jgi:choice-of-anchor A domain-containing protein
MRISVSAAAFALGGSLVLGAFAAPAAVAAPQNCRSLGVANLYGEFVEGDDSHSPDAEGAVAVGGNADFSHGFSVGQELTDDQVKALPGGNALVVGGDVNVGGANTEVMHGNGVYAGQKLGGGRLEGHARTVVHGASPIDFAAEFAQLRGISTALAAQGASAGAAVAAAGDTLTLTGTGADYNAFVLTAAQLQGAKAVQLKVPAGAVTVVTVTGGAYDSRAAGTHSFWLWDHAKQAYVEDDKLQSADGGAVRSHLLWNFPTARTVVKNSPLAWAGSVLAPNAALDLGTGAPVNGSVWVHSLTGSGGAETHLYPFLGCLPATVLPSPPVVVPPTAPGSTPSAPGGSTATPGGTPGAPHPGSATPSASAPGAAAPSPAPSASPSTPATTGHGGLAFTGADGIVPLTVGGVLVLAAGGGIVLATRRRAARKG